MLKKILMSATLAALVVPAAVTTPAVAAPAHTYRGADGRYHYRCKHSSGTTGALIGAGGGGLGAAALGAGPVGLAAGVIGGGLLGRHIDKRQRAAKNRRHGC
ncbi:hypothetical protein [uncultured Sphingomonas sp.]|uniref:hypothetical protein n=1 Tax=uncultured Sphingomonas sp. TaxID=158754 RepID=UPI0026029D06|nr:hypothetical protein [uncultured Sphingomonas sp.]